MELDIQEIQKVIPHRFPFLLIDRVIDLQPNEKLIALKNVSVNEPFFVGHFPDEKVMPGVLIVEAMGRLRLFLLQQICRESLVYYLALWARFMTPVVGDQLS